MYKTLRNLLVTVLSSLLIVGCAVPSGVRLGGLDGSRGQQAESSGPAGVPWSDWFIYGVLSEQDQIRLQDDFYTAVNKDWILEHTDEDYLEWSPVDEREEQIEDQMVGLLEGKAPANEQYGRDLSNLKALYGLAYDWDGRDDDGVKPVMGMVERLRAIKTLDEFSEWLCSDDYRLSQCWEVTSDGDWIGVGLFAFSPYVQDSAFWEDDNDAEADASADGYVLEIDSPSLALAPYFTDDVLDDKFDEDAFREASDNAEIAYNMLLYVGFDEDEATDVLSDAVALESLMAEGSAQDVDFQDVEWLSYDELSQTGSFPIARIAEAYGYDDAGAFAVWDPTWLETMDELYTTENLQLFVSHALVGVLLDSAPMLDTEAYNYVADAGSWADEELATDDELSEPGDFDGASDGTDDWGSMSEEEYEQWFKREACKLATGALPVSFSKLYVEHFYDEETNERVLEMVDDILREYELMLTEEDWLSKATRDAAISKLRAMSVQVGYPSNWQDTSRIEVRSRADGATLYDEVRRLREVRLEEGLAALRDSDANTLWTSCMDVNAYYEPETNSMTIGAGFLGGDFWPEGGSYEELLGSTGVTIGHEISHAFDGHGANFDETGAYRDWWTDKDLKSFQRRVKRVQKCLSKIDPLGRGGYDGERVCDECIADLGGMKVTMRLAAKRPNFNYNTYFRSYAKSWACVMSYDTAREQAETDVHPFDRDRVNIPVREFDEFYDTYGVQEGDGMWLDPKDRISVW